MKSGLWLSPDVSDTLDIRVVSKQVTMLHGHSRCLVIALQLAKPIGGAVLHVLAGYNLITAQNTAQAKALCLLMLCGMTSQLIPIQVCDALGAYIRFASWTRSFSVSLAQAAHLQLVIG